MSDLVSRFGDGDGIQMMLTGTRPAAQLVVCLMTLRRQYPNVPVSILVGDDEAGAVVRRLIDDQAEFGPITSVRWEAPRGTKGIAHANKSKLFEFSPFQRTIFLDADTTIHGPFNELLPRAGTEEVRLTQFSEWVSSGHRISGRLEQYRDLLPREVALAQSNTYPAINTGTFGFSTLSRRYFAELKRVCSEKPVFMADELAAQLIFVGYPHCVLDDRWNHSCLYGTRLGRDESDVRIWHWHGQKHVRADSGKRIWVPLFMEAWDRNISGIREWAPAGDRQLRLWMDANTIRM